MTRKTSATIPDRAFDFLMICTYEEFNVVYKYYRVSQLDLAGLAPGKVQCIHVHMQ